MNLAAFRLARSVLALLLLAGPACAQSALELSTVTALSAGLDPSIGLPSGTFAVSNPKHAQELANRLGLNPNQYSEIQLYVAKGLSARLADAFVLKLETNFLAAGYLKESSSQSSSGEAHSRSSYSNGSQTMLLCVVKRSDGVYFLVAKQK